MKIIERVRKLLALAGNNPSAEEAQAAMVKAQNLLAENGLSAENLEERDTGLRQHRSEFGPRVPTWWRQMIAYTIANNFRCSCFVVTERFSGHKCLLLVGEPDDLAVTVELKTAAFRAADAAARHYCADKKARAIRRGCSWTAKTARTHRNDFLRGWAEGLNEALRKNVEENPGTALAIVKPEALRQMERSAQKTARTRASLGESWEARRAGFRAGSKFRQQKSIE